VLNLQALVYATEFEV